MKVRETGWGSMQDGAVDRTASTRRSSGREKISESKEKTGMQSSRRDMSEDFPKILQGQTAEKSEGGFQTRSSKPNDSVGELAAMLARAETRMDVQQVASKAMRALTSLKMSAAASEGKEAKKIARMIKRMEKLIKRIHKKLEHLAKEERLEEQKKRAEKKQEEQKAGQIHRELRAKRNRRRRDEREYARRELAEDGKENLQEMTSSMMNGLTVPALSGGTDFGGMDVSTGASEGVSIDLSV